MGIVFQKVSILCLLRKPIPVVWLKIELIDFMHVVDLISIGKPKKSVTLL